MIGIERAGFVYSHWRMLYRYQSACFRPFSTQVAKNDQVTKLYAPTIVKEIGPPTGGGPLYWSLRRNVMRLGGSAIRNAKTLTYNMDHWRAGMAGCPKLSYDPKINQWTTFMENDLWDGLAGRVSNDISSTIVFNFLLALLLYFCWFRLVVNNKHNALARWAKHDE